MSDNRLIPCPVDGFNDTADDGQPVYFVELPARWLGFHAQRRDEAIEKSIEQGVKSDFILRFAISMAIAENWHLPGMGQNPEKWDFTQLDLEIIAWVNAVVFDDFADCFNVKKKYYLASRNGLTANTAISQAG